MHGLRLILGGFAAIGLGVILLAVTPFRALAAFVFGGLLIWLGARVNTAAESERTLLDVQPSGSAATETLRIPNERGFALWFVLPIILLVLAAIIGAQYKGQAAFIVIGFVCGLATIAIAYGIFCAIQWVEFGDEVAIHYLCRDRIIPWSELKFVSFEEFDGVHTMTVRLIDGKTVASTVAPNLIQSALDFAENRTSLDWKSEDERIEREKRSEIASALWTRMFIGLIVCILGCVFAVLIFEEINYGAQSYWWSTTAGKTTESMIGSERPKGGAPRVLYFPVVKYKYTVDGHEYEGQRYRLYPVKSNNQEDIELILRTLQPDMEIPVYFKSSIPSVSVLIPGLETWRCVFFAVLIIAGLGGFGFSVSNLRRLHWFLRIEKLRAEGQAQSCPLKRSRAS